MDLTEKVKEPADRYHPQFDGFCEWLDAVAPEQKQSNAVGRRYRRRLVVRRNG